MRRVAVSIIQSRTIAVIFGSATHARIEGGRDGYHEHVGGTITDSGTKICGWVSSSDESEAQIESEPHGVNPSRLELDATASRRIGSN